jgi:hypothetical protein
MVYSIMKTALASEEPPQYGPSLLQRSQPSQLQVAGLPFPTARFIRFLRGNQRVGRVSEKRQLFS